MENLQWTNINGRKAVALPFLLRAALDADAELKSLGIGLDAQHPGLILGDPTTSTWRGEALQAQLLAKGATKTMTSNHRRGVALDVYPDRAYVARIAQTMRKHGLVNDLGDWDLVHFNWVSNAHSWSYPIINELPGFLNQFSMSTFEGFILQLTQPGVPGSGGFAFVEAGHKRHVSKGRMAEFATGMLVRLLAGEHIRAKGVNKADWDAIPDGDDF